MRAMDWITVVAYGLGLYALLWIGLEIGGLTRWVMKVREDLLDIKAMGEGTELTRTVAKRITRQG